MSPNEMLPLITRRRISPAAVRAFRERRGATHEELADVLGVSPGEVVAWEAGTMRVPSAQAYQMRSMAETWKGRIPSGARPPWCPWVNASVPGLYDEIWRFAGDLRFTAEVQRHVDACAECRRVIGLRDVACAGTAQKGGITEPSEEVGPVLTTGETILFYVLLPVWAVAVMTGLFVVPAWLGMDGEILLAGSVGFLAYGIARRVVHSRLPRQPYAAGLAMALSGMVAAMLTWKLQDPQDNLFGSLGLAGCALVALLAGLLTGWMRDEYEAGDAGADDGPDSSHDAEGQHAATDDAPSAVLLAAPDPLAQRDEVREHPRPEPAGVPARE